MKTRTVLLGCLLAMAVQAQETRRELWTWKDANGVETIGEAILELVRIGLLSEIAKVYGMVSDMRDRDDD